MSADRRGQATLKLAAFALRKPTRPISTRLWSTIEGARRSRRARGERANGETIHPQYVSRVVSELASEDAIFTCDVGTPVAWAARYLKMNGRRVVASLNHGSMANAMLHAIGAQATFPKRQVVSFSGMAASR